MDKQRLIKHIEHAFRDVDLGEGMGLREARGIEDQLSQEELKVLRRKDKRQKWRNVQARMLSELESSLHMMNADGMRFYLPAYMIAIINGQVRNVLIFHLTNDGVRGQGRFATLSDMQVDVVRNFLTWSLKQELQVFDKKRIYQALNGMWKKEFESDHDESSVFS